MSERTKIYTLSQVAVHKSKESCWIVINGKVLDVTKFLAEHPGGEEALLEVAGKDVTKEFNDIGHSTAAQKLLLKYQVGVLPGFKSQPEADSGDETYKESKYKEMSAFVIKDDDVASKDNFLLQFFVPLLIAGSYFFYSYLGKTQIGLS